MNKIAITIAISALVFSSCKIQPSDNTQSSLAQQLIERLGILREQGIMYGHQDDPFYGITWEWQQGRSDTYDLLGDYPAVMGFDLGGIEMGDSKNLDSVPFTWIREEAIKHIGRGGIVTFSWHPRNPLLGTTAWIESDIKHVAEAIESGVCDDSLIDPKTTVASILPNSQEQNSDFEGIHEKFVDWMNRVTDFLCTIQDSEGHPLPFILRPWHENNGSWFWWGQNNCSDEEFNALWCMFQDHVRAKLPDNIVWSYSPNLDGFWTEERFMARYPGKDRVQLLGLDAYQWGDEESFIMGVQRDIAFLSGVAQRDSLLFAMTECGLKNSVTPDWWSRVFLPQVIAAKPCYFLPWRNYKEEHFGFSKDAPTADDAKQLADSKQILTLKDIVQM